MSTFAEMQIQMLLQMQCPQIHERGRISCLWCVHHTCGWPDVSCVHWDQMSIPCFALDAQKGWHHSPGKAAYFLHLRHSLQGLAGLFSQFLSFSPQQLGVTSMPCCYNAVLWLKLAPWHSTAGDLACVI